MKKKYNDLVNLRAITILLVMFGHSIILYSSNWSLYEPAVQFPLFDYIKRFIDAIQMPLFFSLAGFLFVHTLKKYTPGSLFLTKAKRLLVPYIIVGSLYLVPIRMFLKFDGYVEMSYFSIVLKNIIMVGDNGHLWYLIVLFVIFVAVGICVVLIRRIKISDNIVCLILFLLGIMANYFRDKPTFGMPYSSFVMTYAIYFIEGYIICVFKDKIDIAHTNKAIVVLAITIFAVMIGVSIYINKPNVVVSTVFVLCAYIIVPRNTNKVMAFIDRNCFGLYLFHSPLIYFMFVYAPNINPILFSLVSFIGLGSVALGITLLLRKIGLGFIIGEKLVKRKS